jgi:hypothetical protein
MQLGLDDLEVASLVPPALAQLVAPADYMAALPQVRCYMSVMSLSFLTHC